MITKPGLTLPSATASLNNCLPATEILKWGQTLRTWNLQKIAKQTEDFCIEDLRSAFELQKMLTLFTQGLGDGEQNGSMKTVTRTSTSGSRPSKSLKVRRLDSTLTPRSFDASNPPTSRLTNGTLEQIYTRLMAKVLVERAMGASGMAMPIFGLFTDPDTSRDLIRQDPELRADFRFAYDGQRRSGAVGACRWEWNAATTVSRTS